MRAKSHELVEFETCPVLVPSLQKSASLLKPLARLVLKSEKPIDLAVTATISGWDVDIRGHGPASPELRMKLTREAEALAAFARDKGHFDVMMEASGNDRALVSAFDALKPQGIIVQVGMGAPATLPLSIVVVKELELRGTFRFHEEFGLGVELLSLDDLFATADYLTLHLPSTPETRGLLGDARFARCKPGIRIINTARGDLIDEAALHRAIESGIVAGAGLDVFNVEPPKDWALAKLPQVIATQIGRAHV